jgi:aminoglycoside phosphotransferase (APT) family kinase protein
VTHSDFTFGNISLGSEGVERPAFIDFAEGERCDPSVDFAYFAEDLEDEGIQPGPILELMFKFYETDDQSIDQKTEFRVLQRKITRVFRRVRKSLRRSEGAKAA